MKNPLALTLLTLTVALSACAPQNANNTSDTNAPSASATVSSSATPTAPVTLEASRDAEHPEYAQGNDYATGMNGTEEQKPGSITTAQPDRHH